MLVKLPVPDISPGPNLRIVDATLPDPEPDGERVRPRVWDSLFVRIALSSLAVGVPFLIVAGFVPNVLGRWGAGVQVGGIILLVATSAVVARFTIRPIFALVDAAARVESGDLSARVVPGGSAEMRQLGHTFNAMLERLTGVLSRLRGEVADTAAHLSVVAEQLAAATLEQTTAATQTSMSMEELARGSIAIAETAARAATQTGEVRANVAAAQADVRLNGERMVQLANRVDDIEGILVLINDIADQTSLLALNAAIEAARAGEAGRGFAVVADEVRRLAERSKAASGQIAALVDAAQVQSQTTVMAVENRGRQMQEWLEMMAAIADASGQVQIATQNQRLSVEETVSAIEHIAESSRLVAATAQEIAIAAARQNELAEELAWSTDELSSRRGKRGIARGA
jgi:methyl-accepting chemotaxis protein